MRILVIRFSSLGDIVLTTAVVRALAQSQPDADVTVATKAQYAPLFGSFEPPITVVPLGADEPFDDYCARLSDPSFDWVIDLHNSLRSRRLRRAVNGRRSARVRKHFWRRLLMVRRKRGLDRPLSTLDNYHDTLAVLDKAAPREEPRLFLSRTEYASVAASCESSSRRLGIGWGARWPTKAVPVSLWSAILERVGHDRVSDIRLFGLEDDREAMQEFARTQRGRGATLPISVACGLSVREVMTRIAACCVFLSSDSGLMHVAAALGVPTIGLFGPTHPALGFAPVGAHTTAIHAGTSCSPCHRHGRAPCYRDRRYCFDDMNPETIAAIVRGYLNATSRETA
ncbi:MAG TPA: glycosyltransferase family 9 protein [Acidobacteriota bacterium]|nr:glycosyltransferase family 9 protein [Acidobacteriota bacterium]